MSKAYWRIPDIQFYWIQGMMFGFEWDWEFKWFSLNFGIFKVIVDYDDPQW